MEPVSAVCIGLAGKGLVCAAAAFDVAVVGGFVTLSGREIVKASTRNRLDWHDYGNAYKKLTALGYTSSIVSQLARTVLNEYTPSWQCMNWIGAGSSDSSRALYEAVKTTSDSYELFRVFQLYLCNDNNNGKRLEVLLRNCIMNY